MILFIGTSSLWEWVQSIIKDFGTKAVVEFLLFPAAVGLVFWLRPYWKRLIGDGAAKRLARLRTAVQAGNGLWLTEPIKQPDTYELLLKSSIPIITLANLKGGVGKSTITANLAGYFAERSERVLVIDLDFQGSLSSMVLGADAKSKRPGPDAFSNASEALAGTKDGAWLVSHAWPSKVQPNLFGLTAFYDLARTENRLMIEWLIEDQPADMPYNLAKLLLSKPVQDAYDRILIDAPPRLSTACVQALCASTHVLIPTVMDTMSTEAVVTFINELENLKAGKVCPHISYVGVVGSMTPTSATTYHRPVAKALKDRLTMDRHAVDILSDECWIKDIPALSRVAGQTVGYADPAQTSDRAAIREAFDPLGQEIAKRVPTRRRLT